MSVCSVAIQLSCIALHYVVLRHYIMISVIIKGRVGDIISLIIKLLWNDSVRCKHCC